MKNCPCGSLESIDTCCKRYIQGETPAPSAVALMRSRYTAYAQANIDYIARTMRAPANQDFDPQEALNWTKKVTWKKLDVISTHTANDKTYVEFKAFYTVNKQECVLHELSEFCEIDGSWFYIDGQIPTSPKEQAVSSKIARNDPCTCGSGIKYKKCCGK